MGLHDSRFTCCSHHKTEEEKQLDLGIKAISLLCNVQLDICSFLEKQVIFILHGVLCNCILNV